MCTYLRRCWLLDAAASAARCASVFHEASPGIFDTNTYFAASSGFVSYICSITSEFRIIWGFFATSYETG